MTYICAWKCRRSEIQICMDQSPGGTHWDSQVLIVQDRIAPGTHSKTVKMQTFFLLLRKQALRTGVDWAGERHPLQGSEPGGSWPFLSRSLTQPTSSLLFVQHRLSLCRLCLLCVAYMQKFPVFLSMRFFHRPVSPDPCSASTWWEITRKRSVYCSDILFVI